MLFSPQTEGGYQIQPIFTLQALQTNSVGPSNFAKATSPQSHIQCVTLLLIGHIHTVCLIYIFDFIKKLILDYHVLRK